MTDIFSSQQPQLNSPAGNSALITKSDTVALPFVTRAIYVGGAGNISMQLVNDKAPVLFTAVPVGTVLYVRAQQVYSTNTTATLLIALW